MQNVLNRHGFFSCVVSAHQEDDDAREIVLEQLLRDGMDLKFNLKFIRVETELPEEEGDFPLIRVVVEQDGEEMVRTLPLLVLTSAIAHRKSMRSSDAVIWSAQNKLNPAAAHRKGTTSRRGQDHCKMWLKINWIFKRVCK